MGGKLLKNITYINFISVQFRSVQAPPPCFYQDKHVIDKGVSMTRLEKNLNE